MSQWYVILECLDGIHPQWGPWGGSSLEGTPGSGSEGYVKAKVSEMQPTVEKGTRWRFHAMNQAEWDSKKIEMAIQEAAK